jgi:hypothetical protein
MVHLSILPPNSSKIMAKSEGWRSISKSRRCTRVPILVFHRNVLGQVVLVARGISKSNLCTKQIFYRRRPAYQCCFLPSGVLKIQTYGHAIDIKTDGDGHYRVCFDSRQYIILSQEEW